MFDNVLIIKKLKNIREYEKEMRVNERDAIYYR